ncbi:hypothetical protein VNI00_004828 [Paramarasmius palmivorus]|uniref:Uncharacterized protein n=1 Tax=Paramarasmius palmivorus TaxID=297713 RepID=A0AAW0DHI4_9AGAR
MLSNWILSQPDASDHWMYTLHRMYWGKDLVNLLQRDKMGNSFLQLPAQLLLDTGGKLLILENYQYLYSRIEAIKAKSKAGLVILGNPGAGKSSFLYFYYLQKLAAAQPVVYCDDPDILIHWDDECFATTIPQLPAGFFENVKFQGVVVLIECEKAPPLHLVKKQVCLYPVQAALPNPDCYKTWITQRKALNLVVNPPSDLDIHRILASDLNGRVSRCTIEEVVAIIKKWGRDIRRIRDVLLYGDKAQEVKFCSQLEEINKSQLNEICYKPFGSSLCHPLNIITTRHSGDIPRQGDIGYLAPDRMSRSVTSEYMFRVFLHHVAWSKIYEPKQFYDLLSCTPQLGSRKGIAFESLAHRLITNCEEFRVYQLGASGTQLIKTEYHTTAQFFTGSKVPPAVFRYPSDTDVTTTNKPRVYSIPQECNNPTFDSFVIAPKSVFKDCADNGLHGIAFQMTVGRKHDLVEKGMKILKARFGPLVGPKHKFVFVVPTGAELALPAPRSVWTKMFDFFMLEIQCDGLDEILQYSEEDRQCDGDPELPPGTDPEVMEMDVFT